MDKTTLRTFIPWPGSATVLPDMTLVILLVIATIWGIWTWKHPVQTFALLPFVLPTYVIRTSIGPLPTTLLELLILTMTVGWMIQGIRGQESGQSSIEATKRFFSGVWRSTVASPFFFPALAWLIAGFISIFVSPNHIAAIGLYRAYFIEPLMLFIIGTELTVGNRESKVGSWKNVFGMLNFFFRKKSSKKNPESRFPSPDLPSALTSSFAIVLILLGIYAIIQMLTGWGIPTPWEFISGRRAVGPFPFPNALALFVTPIAALMFADFIQGLDSSKTRLISPWLSLPAYLAGLICVILAASDGGLIALGAASGLILLMQKRTRMAAIGLAAAGAILIASIAPLREHVTTVLMFREWSSKVRIVMWQETLLMLKDHKLMGAGLGGYPMVIKVYHRSGNWMEIFQYPHNIILNLWSETGLLGLAAFGWILWTWAQGTGHRTQNKTSADDAKQHPYVLRPTSYVLILPIIIAILVHGLVDVPYFKNDLAIVFWLLILVTTYAGDIRKDHT